MIYTAEEKPAPESEKAEGAEAITELHAGDLIQRKAINLRGAVAHEVKIPCRFVRWHNQDRGEVVVEYRRVGALWPYEERFPEGSFEVLRPEEYESAS